MKHMIEGPPLTRKEIEKELLRLEEAHGLSPEQFVEACRAGEVPETPETIEWAELIAAYRIASRGDF